MEFLESILTTGLPMTKDKRGEEGWKERRPRVRREIFKMEKREFEVSRSKRVNWQI